MAVNLKKGEKVNLSSSNNKVNGVIVGLGWDSAGNGEESVDCDASAILCDRNGKVLEVVYFGQQFGANNTVAHRGDNRTGVDKKKTGNAQADMFSDEDEQIFVYITKLPPNISKIVFAVNIYDAKIKRQHFGMINRAFIRVRNGQKNEELYKYNLTDNYSGMTGIIVAEMVRRESGWDFVTIGRGIPEASRLQSIVNYIDKSNQ